MAQCGICTKERDHNEDFTYLSIYVIGSEGLEVCLDCRMMITDYVRHMKLLVARAKMLGVKIGRRET